jgi:hypothetical protein
LAYVVACSARLLIVSAGHQSPLDVVRERGEGYLVIQQTSGTLLMDACAA